MLPRVSVRRKAVAEDGEGHRARVFRGGGGSGFFGVVGVIGVIGGADYYSPCF